MDSTRQNHYLVLGVPRTATQKEIEERYKNIAAHHERKPDKNDLAEESFSKIAAAYEVLSDPARRTDYDSRLFKEITTSAVAGAAAAKAAEREQQQEREQRREKEQIEAGGEEAQAVEDEAAEEQQVDRAYRSFRRWVLALGLIGIVGCLVSAFLFWQGHKVLKTRHQVHGVTYCHRLFAYRVVEFTTIDGRVITQRVGAEAAKGEQGTGTFEKRELEHCPEEAVRVVYNPYQPGEFRFYRYVNPVWFPALVASAVSGLLLLLALLASMQVGFAVAIVRLIKAPFGGGFEVEEQSG